MLTTQYITKCACVVNSGHADFCHSLMSQNRPTLISTTYVGQYFTYVTTVLTKYYLTLIWTII